MYVMIQYKNKHQKTEKLCFLFDWNLTVILGQPLYPQLYVEHTWSFYKIYKSLNGSDQLTSTMETFMLAGQSTDGVENINHIKYIQTQFDEIVGQYPLLRWLFLVDLINILSILILIQSFNLILHICIQELLCNFLFQNKILHCLRLFEFVFCC